jgi:DNA-directed RNA polymerase subunit RPC12/RpoP
LQIKNVNYVIYSPASSGYSITADNSALIDPVNTCVHDYTGVVTTAATCTTAGVMTYTCSKCGNTYTEAIPALGHDWVKGETTAATCTAAGYTTYTCSRCGATKQADATAALGHDWVKGETTAATCTAAGYTTYTCSRCGATKQEDAVAALGHSWDAGTVTTEATEYAQGVMTYTCSRCGTTYTEAIPALAHNCPSAAFTDVDISKWYHAGIDFAVSKGYMAGTGKTEFSPNASATRAMLVMVLYRVAGSPDVTGLTTPFTDVRESAYYQAAVTWAYNKSIIAGTTKTTFSPNTAITREQFATILYSYAGASAPTENLIAGYPDYSTVSLYAVDAMNWAVSQGLISGIKNTDGTVTLSPKASTTRAQMATILMRFLQAGN